MTNRDMVKPGPKPEPNAAPLPSMPAPEGSARPTTDREPIDSPQPNASVERDPPDRAKIGLTTDRKA